MIVQRECSVKPYVVLRPPQRTCFLHPVPWVYSFQMLYSLFQTPALDNCGTRLQDHRFAPLCTHADPAIDRDAAFIVLWQRLSSSQHIISPSQKCYENVTNGKISIHSFWYYHCLGIVQRSSTVIARCSLRF